MNRTAGFLLLNLLVFDLGPWAMPTQAQGFKINRDYLPDGSKIERSRLKLQLVDTNPEITDHRRRKDQTEYIMNVSAIPPDPPAPTVVPAGSELPCPVRESVKAPPAKILPDKPGESRFGSNLGGGSPQRTPPHRNANPGFKWVSGRLTNKPIQKPLPGPPEPERHPSAPVKVAQYAPSQDSSPVAAGTEALCQTSISARGRLLRSK